MLQSGIAQRTEDDLDFNQEEELRVHLLIRDLKPPFLDGKVIYTTQLECIKVVRDETSDLARFARNGSAVVKQKREERERARVYVLFCNHRRMGLNYNWRVLPWEILWVLRRLMKAKPK